MQNMFFNIIMFMGWEETVKTQTKPQQKLLSSFFTLSQQSSNCNNVRVLTEALENFHLQLPAKTKDLANYYVIQHMILLLSMLLISASFNSADCIFHQMCFFLCKILGPQKFGQIIQI